MVKVGDYGESISGFFVFIFMGGGAYALINRLASSLKMLVKNTK